MLFNIKTPAIPKKFTRFNIIFVKPVKIITFAAEKSFSFIMCTSQECVKILNEHMPRIQSEFGVTGMCIFGSVARGDNRSDSDIDILVDMPPKILLLSSLKEYLEQILQSSVDLVRRHSRMSARFLTQISNDALTVL